MKKLLYSAAILLLCAGYPCSVSAIEGWEPERSLLGEDVRFEPEFSDQSDSEMDEYPGDWDNGTDSPVSAETDEYAVVSGTYRWNVGLEDGTLTVKDANYLLQEKSWRYFYGEKKENTFDPAIFNRLQVFVHTPPTDRFRIDAEIVIDPWSFLGTSQEITVPSWYAGVDGDDPVTLQWKYWSNNSRTYPEIIRSQKGDSFALPEVRVNNGYVPAVSVAGGFDSGTAWVHRIDIPELKISRQFKPIRRLEFSYRFDELTSSIFLYKREYDMPYSDDPLGLINRHITWEPSPWIDEWIPGVAYTATGAESGEWYKDYLLRDSESSYLRLIRGAGVLWEADGNSAQLVAATPLDPWQDYDRINNIPLAFRTKHSVSDEVTVGTIYTARWGYVDSSVDAFDQTVGVDSSVQLTDYLGVSMEFARAFTERNMATGVLPTDDEGDAARVVADWKNDFFEMPFRMRFSFAALDDDFDPPLAHYRFTRDDQSWASHIWFSERSKAEEDYRIGDSIDANRSVAGIDFLCGEALTGQSFFNFRNVNRSTDGAFIENIFRYENLYQPQDDITFKFLALYNDQDRTADGTKQDTLVVGAGVGYDFNEWVRWEQSLERRNLYPEFPGTVYDWLTINPPAPFPFYSISKSRMVLRPLGWLDIALEHVWNEFKYAALYDDMMNYSGIDSVISVTEEVELRLVYRYSRVADYLDGGTYAGHHNVYADLSCAVGTDRQLRIQFGALGNYVAGQGWQTSVLDTQSLVRLSFTGSF